MDQNQELAVAQLRESVQKLGGSTQRFGDLTLMRFLIARSMDIEKAAKMFVQWQKWRASFVPLNYIPESEIPDELSAEKIYLQGPSRKGFPVVLGKVNKHFPAKDQLQFKSKNVFIFGLGCTWDVFFSTVYICACGLRKLVFRQNITLVKLIVVSKDLAAELRICGVYARQNRCKVKISLNSVVIKFQICAFRGKEIGNEKLIGVLDLQQLSYKNIDPRGLITGFQFLQSYYPERLAKCYLLHMPGFFVRVWRFVSRFLEKATLEKIVIVTSEEETREFMREVGEDALPEEYGGKAKLMPIQDVVLTPLDD
ncbi:UNVERIFIED_CONTAM: hypothetical protein Slati_1799500 [Sesamum latifolium]|uniref:CRAL-TRIO domain-containing protein n=1 Tax=Sesamum latifolium TaxID=2727402 RepID=A0AAW2X0S7_9LAMI